VVLLLPSAELGRHIAGTVFVGASSAASGIEITGNGVATAILTAATVVGVVITVWNGNRKTRREVARDTAAGMRRAWRKGARARDAQWQAWLNFNLAQGRIELKSSASAPPSTQLPPSDPGNDEDEDSDDD
jgi:hypothetical protein